MAVMSEKETAATFELLGSFLLSELKNKCENVGLHRENGLAAINATPRDTEVMKKDVCHIFTAEHHH